MKYLYELNLNHRELIMSKVTSLCELDTNISGGCVGGELKSSIIALFSCSILCMLENQSLCPEKVSFDVGFDELAGDVNAAIVRSYFLSGISIKFLIAILKHFRSSINDTIYQNMEDKDAMFEYLETNNRYFDSLQFSLYNQYVAMQKNDILLEKVFENTPYAVYIQDGQHITYVNKIGEKMCGYNLEELKLKSIFDIIHPDYIYVLKQNKEIWDSTGKVTNGRYECKILNKSGTEVWIDISIGEIEIGGRRCMLGSAIDNTDCMKLEELKLQASESIKQLNEIIELDKIKTEFFSNLSHELRTPLNVLLGTLQLVDMYSTKTLDPIIEKTKKYYKIMKQNCYRLLRLVNNLVDLNKLDAGYMHLNMGNHDIIDVVTEIATSVSDYIENKGICFEYNSKTDRKIIACDPDKIERIVLNLLSNAIKFTDSGGKILFNVWDEDDKIFISVKDTGIGISKEKQDLVFRRFVQIDKSLSRNHNGSGIGLSLAKSLVELHGGKISLISDAGMGCEFIIELPIKELNIMEVPNKKSEYSVNNKIEVINIEFSDIYS